MVEEAPANSTGGELQLLRQRSNVQRRRASFTRSNAFILPGEAVPTAAPGTPAPPSSISLALVSTPDTSGSTGRASFTPRTSSSYGSKGGEKKKDPCDGCERELKVSTDWLASTEDFDWAYPDCRGRWCAGCLGVWRFYQSTTPLSTFHAWLGGSRINRIDFYMRHAANVALQAAGEERVTLQKVLALVEAFKVMPKFVGILFPLCFCLDVTDLAKSPWCDM